jgi:hypothetical protein
MYREGEFMIRRRPRRKWLQAEGKRGRIAREPLQVGPKSGLEET